MTGNPTVIKMVVSFNRGARGQNALRQILAPVVKEIIDDKSLNIKTDPVDIYKSWVNQMESQTGEARYGNCYYCVFLNVVQLLCIALLIIHGFTVCICPADAVFSISLRRLSSESCKDHVLVVLRVLEGNITKMEGEILCLPVLNR